LAKLLKILAASVGGGLVLGAGIRLGEALAAQLPGSTVESGHQLAERLGELENRLLSLEAENPAVIGSRSAVETQAFEKQALQPDADGPHIDVASETALRLRGELREWLEENVTARMAEAETRLRTESERGRSQMLDAFAESVQTRVIQRISRLEEEVASQSAAMSELRECSLRTERSVHKLLGGLDKLIVKNSPAAEGSGGDMNPAPEAFGNAPAGVTSAGITPAESGALPVAELPADQAAPATSPEPLPVIEPPAFEGRPKSSRWKIFG
jgi:hypothetical protein